MTWNRYEPPLELRAAVRQWQQQSGALSALPDAPVEPGERAGRLSGAAALGRRVVRRTAVWLTGRQLRRLPPRPVRRRPSTGRSGAPVRCAPGPPRS